MVARLKQDEKQVWVMKVWEDIAMQNRLCVLVCRNDNMKMFLQKIFFIISITRGSEVKADHVEWGVKGEEWVSEVHNRDNDNGIAGICTTVEWSC